MAQRNLCAQSLFELIFSTTAVILTLLDIIDPLRTALMEWRQVMMTIQILKDPDWSALKFETHLAPNSRCSANFSPTHKRSKEPISFLLWLRTDRDGDAQKKATEQRRKGKEWDVKEGRLHGWYHNESRRVGGGIICGLPSNPLRRTQIPRNYSPLDGSGNLEYALAWHCLWTHTIWANQPI